MPKYICLNCKKEYTSRKKTSKFCSVECRHEYNQIHYNCDCCGKPMIIYRSRYKKLLSGEKHGIYCSKECTDKAHTFKVTNICKNCGKEYKIYRAFEDVQQFCSRECFDNYRKENSKKHEVKCEYCGKIFTTVRDDQRFCSHECSGKAQRNRVTCICDNCGKEFERIKSEVNKRKTHYCSMDCKIQGMFWNQHDLWILRNYYNKISIKEIQDKLSKNWALTAIRRKAQLLGLGKDRLWTDSEIELFKELYPVKPMNEVLSYFPGRTKHSLIHQGRMLGIKSYFYNNRIYTDEEMNYYIENYLTSSDEDMAKKFNRHTSLGIHQKLYGLGYTRPYEIKKDGYTNLKQFVRERLIMWKKDVLEYYNYTCCLTGARSNIIIHHCRGFSILFDETVELLDFKIKDNFKDYTDDELLLFVNKFLELQDYYHAYVCVTESVHKLFHKTYGYGDNTEEQWDEFVNDYRNGKYENIA